MVNKFSAMMAPKSLLINNLEDSNSLIRIFSRQKIIRLQILLMLTRLRNQELPQISRN